MSKKNFENVLHIIRKLNWYFGMTIQDIEYLDYSEEEKTVLKHVINSAGNILLDQVVNVAVMVDKLSNLRAGDPNWAPSTNVTDNVQNEFHKVFGDDKKNSKTENVFPEGQKSKKDEKESKQDTPGAPGSSEGPFS